MVAPNTAFVASDIHSLFDLNYIEVFSLSNRAPEFDARTRQKIKKEFNRAAAAFANKLAGGGKGNGSKNKALARELTSRLRLLDYIVFTKVNPIFSEALKAKNLVFKVRAEYDAGAKDYKFGEQDWILAPKKKLSFPFQIVTRGNRETIEFYFTDANGFNVSLPLDQRELAKEPRAKSIIIALQGGSLNRSRHREMCRAQEATDDLGEVVALTGGRRGKPNRHANRARPDRQQHNPKFNKQ